MKRILRVWMVLAVFLLVLPGCMATEQIRDRWPDAYVTPEPQPEAFTMIWLTDTQSLVYGRPDYLIRVGKWIGSRKDRDHLVCVLHTGDAVENGLNPAQWDVIRTAREQFSDIPLFMVAGNHDVGRHLLDYTGFLMQEDVRRISESNRYEGGKALCMPVSAGGRNLLLLGAGWGAESESAEWMGEILDRYPDHTAILLFHSFIKPGGYSQKQAKALLPTLVRDHPNVRMILCGHLKGSALRTERYDDDGDGIPEREVNILLYNFQDEYKDAGQVRILRFDPASGNVKVTTYSPVTGRYYRDMTTHTTSFTLENAF